MNTYPCIENGFPTRRPKIESELPKLLELIVSLFGPTAQQVLLRAYHACRKFLLVKVGKYAYRILSWFLNNQQKSALMDNTTYRYPDLRKALFHPFAYMDLILHSKNHSHHDSAVLRSSTTAKMETVITTAGLIPYSISASPREAFDGSRCYYSPKDLAVPYRFDEIHDNHVIMLVDVDYYLDINEILKLGRPVLIYTFVPTSVAGRNNEQSWSIKDDKATFIVRGGSAYSHYMWDYAGDTISVIADNLALIVYSVEQKQFDQDKNRRVISLLPRTLTRYPYYLPLPFQDGLKRTQYTYGDVSVIYDPISDLLSIGNNGDQFSVELEGKSFYAIKKRLASKTSAPLGIDIERMLKDDIEDKPETASILLQLIGTDFKANFSKTAIVQTNFQSTVGSKIDDGSTTEYAMMDSLLVFPAVYPCRSYNNDLAMIAGRIEKPRNVAEPAAIYNKFAREFSELLLDGGEHSLLPLTIAQVVDIQNKPSQRARSDLVKNIMTEHFKVKLQPFQKSEGYSSANSPRNITSLNAEATLVFSTITYPFKWRFLKKTAWYTPGMTPNEIEFKLSGMKGALLSTDFSRFDGSISKWLQNRIVRTNYTQSLHGPHNKDLLYKKFNEMHHAKATTRNGVWYDPGYGTKSGSPFTTDGNTMINAFVSYAAFRQLGDDVQVSWASLGLYCGDDGLVQDRQGLRTSLLKVCQDLGLTIELIQVPDMEPIPFCGRFFMRADLECVSFADPMRTLAKFHLTSNKQVTPTQALINKACGYAATDASTPIISALLNRIFVKYGNLPKNMLPEEEFRANNSWTQADRNVLLPYFLKVTGMDQETVDRLEDEILTSDLKVIVNKIQNEVKHKIPAAIGDTLVGQPTKRIRTPPVKLKLSMQRNENAANDVEQSNGILRVSADDAEAIPAASTHDPKGIPVENQFESGGSKSYRNRSRRPPKLRPVNPVPSDRKRSDDVDPEIQAPQQQRRSTRRADKPRRQAKGSNGPADQTGFDRAVQMMELMGIDWKKHFTATSKL